MKSWIYGTSQHRLKRGNPILILVGNKSDRDFEREVSREEGQAQARRFGCEFIETSAKSGQNIQRVFTDSSTPLGQGLIFVRSGCLAVYGWLCRIRAEVFGAVRSSPRCAAHLSKGERAGWLAELIAQGYGGPGRVDEELPGPRPACLASLAGDTT